MADAYLRFSIDGVKLRSYGTGRYNAAKIFIDFSLGADKGLITNKNTRESSCLNSRIKEGSIVKIELIYRIRRKNKPISKRLIAITEFKVDRIERQDWNFQIYFKTSITNYIPGKSALQVNALGPKSSFIKAMTDNPMITMLNTSKPEFKITERKYPTSNI